MIKRIAPIFIWTAGIIVTLIILGAASIQIPPVQRTVIQWAMVFVNTKMEGKIAIAQAGITFPGSIFIDGLFIEDPAHDTLLYAGNVKVTIDFFALLFGTIHIHSMSLKNTVGVVSRTDTDSLFNYRFLLTAFAATTPKTSQSPAIHLRIDNIALDSVRFVYDDRYGDVSVTTSVRILDLKMKSIDLRKLDFNINDLVIDGGNCSVAVKKRRNPLPPTADQPEVHVAAHNLSLSNYTFTFNDTDVPEKKGGFHRTATGCTGGFDASHMHFSEILLQADNVAYSSTRIKAHVTNASVRDSGRLYLSNLSTEFLMDKHGINASNLVLRTTDSDINCSIGLTYDSLEQVSNTPDRMGIAATINHATIGVDDVFYFVPSAASNSFLRRQNTAITAAGSVTGPLHKLTGDQLVIGVGNQTLLKTDCVITGLPDVNKLRFSVPKLHMTTGRDDIEHLLGTSMVPTGISLPEHIELDAHGKGTLKAFETSFKLTTNDGTISGRGAIDTSGVYDGTINIADFNAGVLLKNTDMFGPVDAQVNFSGRGLNKNTVNVKVSANASRLYLNNYSYKNLKVDGIISGRQYNGKISINDPNAVGAFVGLVNLTPGKERYTFTIDLKKANLQPLTFFKDNTRIAAKIVVDARGKDFDSFTGKAAITHIVVEKQKKEYRLDSLAGTSVILNGEHHITLASDLMDLQYNGTVAPSGVAAEVNKFVHCYYSKKNTVSPSPVHPAPQHFTFTVKVHQHRLLSEVLLPKLTGYSPCSIIGSFNTKNDWLLLHAVFPKIEYSGTSVTDATVTLDADVHELNCQATILRIAHGPLSLDNVSLDGRIRKQEGSLILSAVDDNGFKKLLVKAKGTQNDSGYWISIDSSEVYLGNVPWTVASDNVIEVGDSGVSIHNLSLSSPSGRITISSVNDSGVDALKIGIVNLAVNDISRLLVSDTALVAGLLNAEVLLKKADSRYNLAAHAAISDIFIKSIPVGTISIKADKSATDNIAVEAKLTGKGNDISAGGTVVAAKDSIGLNLKVDITTLSLKTIEALSMGSFTEGSGRIGGSFTVKGTARKPAIIGNMQCNDVYFNPSVLNNRLHLENENIEFTPAGILFNHFTVTDRENHFALIDGVVTVHRLPEIGFDLNITADNFNVFSTTSKDNNLFFGNMIVDSRIHLQGSSTLPVIESHLTLRNGSHLTFAVPERFVTTNKGEGVVLFIDTSASGIHPESSDTVKNEKGGPRGFKISSDIAIDEKATLRLLLDPASKDSFDLRGSGLLKLNLNTGGTVDLSGKYTLTEGKYVVSFKSLIERTFTILRGGTMIFNGDPSAAEIDIKAVCAIITSPIDLVANQISGLSDAEKNGFRGRLTFLVNMHLRGPLLKPDITFELQLLPEDKGALGGAVNAKLMQLNADPSSLDKQVFSLLVLGRFLQENPVESSSGRSSFSSVTRSGVSSFLSGQLRQWGAGVVPGLNLDLGLKSYEDFSSGKASGRTQVAIGVKKQLFNDRLSVKVGGAVDVEGARAQQNTADEIVGDVVVEYKITADGRYRLKAFRKNVYEDPIYGQLMKTAVGVSLTRLFNRWDNLFRKPTHSEKNKNAP